ncbi:MAG TPA: RDD family protein [Steroidobacteraceae bacterium]|nr:RDD family protein [Steroidobacteraceae bacterium]
MLDSVVAAETPEGILLELRPAGLSARFCAFAIDWLIRIAILWVAMFIFGLLGGAGIGLWLVLLFVLDWFYPVYFELGRKGATPGKRALDLKVVMDNGLPITPAASITRNLLRVADLMPAGFGAAVFCMLVRPDGKRLGDLAAGTLVVHQPRPAPKATLEMVAPIAPARALSPRDQAAVISLAARAPSLTIERLDELAALARSVQGDEARGSSEVTRRVLGVAQWLLGRRS